MATVLDLIWVRWQQVFFGKSERKDSTALPPDGQITRAGLVVNTVSFSHSKSVREITINRPARASGDVAGAAEIGHSR
jgi:hypothetical protein